MISRRANASDAQSSEQLEFHERALFSPMGEVSSSFPLRTRDKNTLPMAKTCGIIVPSDFPLYRLIVSFEYKPANSLYGLIAIKIFAT